MSLDDLDILTRAESRKEIEMNKGMEDSLAMNGGDGPNSYTRNSKFQGEGSDRVKVLLSDSIQETLTIQDNTDVANGPLVFCIADLGCSVGPNTFSCVQTIIEAVQLKFKTHSLESKSPEFHVFFNDLISNDFNILFKALPLDRQYMAAGVPGSFRGRLFPKATMNIMHSSFALHWLANVPEEVTKQGSPAWNKGRITYVGSSHQVMKAYTDQFLTELETFFSARSVEMASNGLMVILIPCRPEGTLPSESFLMHSYDCLGYALADLAKEGLVDEALVDSFNIPIFIPTASELKAVVSGNEHLSIERMEEIYYPPRLSTPEDARLGSVHIRATMESILCKHFGSEIMDELFERCTQKLKNYRRHHSPLALRSWSIYSYLLSVIQFLKFS